MCIYIHTLTYTHKEKLRKKLKRFRFSNKLRSCIFRVKPPPLFLSIFWQATITGRRWMRLVINVKLLRDLQGDLSLAVTFLSYIKHPETYRTPPHRSLGSGASFFFFPIPHVSSCYSSRWLRDVVSYRSGCCRSFTSIIYIVCFPSTVLISISSSRGCSMYGCLG